MSWKLTCNNVTKTFEEWGIRNAQRTLVSLDVDKFTFDVTGAFDSDDLFPPDANVTVLNGDEIFFAGRIDQTPRTANGRYETFAYVVVGPWWDVQDLTYQIVWKQLANPLDPTQGFVTELRGHILLNIDNIGRRVSTKAQIVAVLNYVLQCADATGRPRPFQVGSVEMVDAIPFDDEVTDRKCAEIIIAQLRWTPDAVCWFDYRTSPPTLHLKQRDHLEPITLQFGAKPLTEVSITPRSDLEISEVVIKYESTNVVNGVGYWQMSVDSAPAGATGRGRRAIVMTVNLEGSQINYSIAKIACEEVKPADANWWKAQYHPLADENVTELQITEFSRTTQLPRELISGNVTGWMLSRYKAQAARELIKAKANWNVAEGADQSAIQKNVEKPIHTEIVTTDLRSGTYYSSLSVKLAEPVPIGLANYLWQSTKALQFDGRVILVEDECSGSVGLGQMVNISGAKPEYATMNAAVQSIEEDIGAGQTTIRLGPAKHLGIDQIIEFLKAARQRRRSTPTEALTDGQSYSAAPVDIGEQTPAKNSNADNGKVDKFTVGQSFIFDRADNKPFVPDAPSPQIRAREYPICLKGENYFFRATGTLPYKKNADGSVTTLSEREFADLIKP
jgi:hypothetical protein